MTDAIFPVNIGISYKAAKKANWNPQVRKSISGKRRSLLFYESPIVELTLPIGHMYTANEMDLLFGFYNYVNGEHQPFYFFDQMNPQADVSLGTGDGNETDFQLLRTWGYDDLYVEYPVYPATYVTTYLGYGLDGYLTPDITGFGVPVPPLPTVYIDGVELTSGWGLSADGKITFDTAPAAGEVITADFYHCYLVAFSEKTSPDFVHEYYNGWSTNIVLETVIT